MNLVDPTRSKYSTGIDILNDFHHLFM